MVYVAPAVVFVLYRGDDPIGVGTANELEAATGVPARMVRYYATPSARQRAGSVGLLAEKIKLKDLPNE